MDKTQKKNMAIVALIGVIYFCLFIIPNLAGSKDAIMLSVFEQDEFAEYPYVLRMLTSDLSFYQTLRYFIIYLFYYYGYPFFFFSALSLLPLKWIIGADWTRHTQLIVLVLRQLINVLPGILSVGFLVYLQTRFVSRWKTILLFIGLLLFPPLVINNMWWHPDGLLLLFSVLAIFFLVRDNFRFKSNFFFAAIAVGLAVSTKIVGLFFFLSILLYLVYGCWQKKISKPKMALFGVLFILVMAVAYLVSNPVILLPIERGEVIAAYKSGFSQLSAGFYEKSSGLIKWADSWPNLSKSYGSLFFVLLTLAVPVFGIIKNKNRLVNLIILGWAVVHYVYFSFFVTTMKDYYLLPSALPLAASLGTLLCILPDRLMVKRPEFSANKKKWALMFFLAIIIAVQSALFLKTNISNYVNAVTREDTSINLRFFEKLNEEYLSRLPADRNLVIYRDWRAYVKEQPNWSIEIDWNFANYEYLKTEKPDVLILEVDNIHYFSQESVMQNSLNQAQAIQRFEFYADASDEIIEGYRFLYKDDFGVAFVSDALFNLYFK